MVDSLWKVAITIAGIGGIGAFVFYSLYKQWLNLGVFATLTRDQTFQLFRLFLIFSFAFGVIALGSYTFVTLETKSEQLPTLKYTPGADLVTVTLVFNSTGERKNIELPLDLISSVAAQHIVQDLYLSDAARRAALTPLMSYTLVVNQREIPRDQTLREAKVKNGDEIKVKIERIHMPMFG